MLLLEAGDGVFVIFGACFDGVAPYVFAGKLEFCGDEYVKTALPGLLMGELSEARV